MRRLVPLVVAALSALLVVLIVTDWWPVLRGPAPETDQWYWPYLLRPLDRWGWPLTAGGLLAGAGLWWLRAPDGRRVTIGGLVLLAVLHVVWQLGFVYADASRIWWPAADAVAAELVDRTLPPASAGFFWTAAQLPDLNAALRDYPALMATFESDHTRTHPPGLVAANWLTMRAFQGRGVAEPLAAWVNTLRCTDAWLFAQPPEVAAALSVWSWLPLAAAALTIPLVFALTRQLAPAAPLRGARAAALLAAGLPGPALFAPKSVQLFPPLIVLLVLLWQRALERRGRRSAVQAGLAGLVFSVATLLSVGNGTIVLLLGLTAVAQLGWPRSRAWVVAGGRLGLPFLLGGLSLWALYTLGWGVWPWEIVRRALAEHYTIVAAQRPYADWVLYNLIDLCLFAGPPVVIGLLGAVWSWRRRSGADTTWAVCLLAYVLALDLSGSVRGEAGRIWVFFMPLLAAPAALWLQPRRAAGVAWLALLGITCAIGLAWRPDRPVIVVAQPPAPVPTWTPEITRSDLFGPTIRLSGATVQLNETTLDVTLLWTALGRTPVPYTGFVHVVDAAGVLVAQQDRWPVSGNWPPTCWQPGDRVTDGYRVVLDDLPAGEYWVWVGLYDARNLAQAGPPVRLQAITLPPR